MSSDFGVSVFPFLPSGILCRPVEDQRNGLAPRVVDGRVGGLSVRALPGVPHVFSVRAGQPRFRRRGEERTELEKRRDFGSGTRLRGDWCFGCLRGCIPGDVSHSVATGLSILHLVILVELLRAIEGLSIESVSPLNRLCNKCNRTKRCSWSPKKEPCHYL